MARKKIPDVFAKWSACHAKLSGSVVGAYSADIYMHDQIIDTISSGASERVLRSLCLAYMKDLSPSKSALEARYRMFVSRLKTQYGLDPGDICGREEVDAAIALNMLDNSCSMVAGIDAYLRTIGEKNELERIDKTSW